MKLGQNPEGKWVLLDNEKQEIGRFDSREEGVAAMRAATPVKDKTTCKHAELAEERLAVRVVSDAGSQWLMGRFCHRCKNIIFKRRDRVVELTREEFRSQWLDKGLVVPPVIEDIIATKH